MQILIIRSFSFDSLKKIVNFEPDKELKATRYKFQGDNIKIETYYNMEDFKKKNAADMNDKEIVFSQSIKAGKRIYYLDVKKNRKDEMFLAITESKKIVMGEGDDSQVSFEKHKIFLYKEDFEKFMNGLQQAIGFIQEQQGCYTRHTTDEEAESPETGKEELPKEEKASSLEGEIKIDIEF